MIYLMIGCLPGTPLKHLVFLFCSGGEKFYGWFIAVFHAWHSLEQRKLTIPPVTFSIQSSNNDTLENTPGLFLWHRFSIPLGEHFQRSHKIGNVDGVESLKIVVSLGKVKTTVGYLHQSTANAKTNHSLKYRLLLFWVLTERQLRN